MLDVDRAGIARTAKRLGAEGTNILLLRASRECSLAVLDAALPVDRGDGPANGGWFAGPGGPMLLVEGLDEQVDMWIASLVQGLRGAGVDGTLTGAPGVAPPRWAQVLSKESRYLNVSIGFRTSIGTGFKERSGWAAGAAARDAAVAIAMDWLTARGGDVMTSSGGTNFWVDPPAAAALLTAGMRDSGNVYSASYDRARNGVRHVASACPSAVTLMSQNVNGRWPEAVEELRAALLAAPLDLVVVAMVSHRGMGTYVGADVPGSDVYDRMVYLHHPERWDEVVLEPSGIQVLTNRHLEHARDLSGWHTTRLDDDHVLVEALDLSP